MAGEMTACRRIAPEDVRPGIFIAVLSVVHEVYPPAAFEAPWTGPPRPVRITCVRCADGEPLRVVSVCLPFVQAEDAQGDLRRLDLRQHVLGRLDESYAMEAFTRPERSEY